MFSYHPLFRQIQSIPEELKTFYKPLYTVYAKVFELGTLVGPSNQEVVDLSHRTFEPFNKFLHCSGGVPHFNPQG